MTAGRELDALVEEKVFGADVCRCDDVRPDRLEVVETLDLFRKLGTDIGNAFLTRYGKWSIEVLTGMAANDGETIAEADTVPHVICLAALKAVGALEA